jgi:peptide/nickel transport system permease protein
MSTAPVELDISQQIATKPRSLWVDVWRQFRKHKLAMVGLVVFVLIILAVIVGPLVYTTSPTFIDFSVASSGMTRANPLGTNNLGQDTLARVLVGGRISLAVGVSAMFIAITIGTVVGGLAGYYPALDGPLMRLADMFFALPQLPLLLVIILLFRDTLRGLYGPETGIFLLMVFVIGILAWMPTARLVRGEVLSLKQQEFVTAAISIGTRSWRILLRHIFPNVLSPIMVSATLGIANAIITESALSFLGLGFPPDFPTWGRILFDGKDALRLTPLLVIAPGMAISLTVLSVNFIGDGLRDALDPRLRGR